MGDLLSNLIKIVEQSKKTVIIIALTSFLLLVLSYVKVVKLNTTMLDVLWFFLIASAVTLIVSEYQKRKEKKKRDNYIETVGEYMLEMSGRQKAITYALYIKPGNSAEMTVGDGDAIQLEQMGIIIQTASNYNGNPIYTLTPLAKKFLVGSQTIREIFLKASKEYNAIIK